MPLIGTRLCLETLVSRTAIRLISVVFPVWSKTAYFDQNSLQSSQAIHYAQKQTINYNFNYIVAFETNHQHLLFLFFLMVDFDFRSTFSVIEFVNFEKTKNI